MLAKLLYSPRGKSPLDKPWFPLALILGALVAAILCACAEPAIAQAGLYEPIESPAEANKRRDDSDRLVDAMRLCKSRLRGSTESEIGVCIVEQKEAGDHYRYLYARATKMKIDATNLAATSIAYRLQKMLVECSLRAKGINEITDFVAAHSCFKYHAQKQALFFTGPRYSAD